MAFVIGPACVDVMDRSCIQQCPVDCIYVGERMAYVNPEECIDCGACEPVCPAEAIMSEDQVPPEDRVFAEENARFFTETLPGRTVSLGSPGGAAKTGEIGVDTPFVQRFTTKGRDGRLPMTTAAPPSCGDPRRGRDRRHRRGARRQLGGALAVTATLGPWPRPRARPSGSRWRWSCRWP
jgi:NAD-dependent dihydropyrimidine dehydrogenase PreA subunit